MKRRLGIILGIVILVVLVALLFIVPAITGGETAEGNWELTSRGNRRRHRQRHVHIRL